MAIEIEPTSEKKSSAGYLCLMPSRPTPEALYGNLYDVMLSRMDNVGTQINLHSRVDFMKIDPLYY